MILGDSLHVMACLAEREGLRGKVQCILRRSALRHQVQQQFPVEHHQSRREGRQHRVSRALKAGQKRALGRATAPAVDRAIRHIL